MNPVGDKEEPRLVGGVYPFGDKRCVSLQELEASVPAHVLLQFVSSVFINKPTVRELIQRHGRTAWGTSAGNQTSPSSSSSSSSKGKKPSRKQPIKITPVVRLGGASSHTFPSAGVFSTIQILRSLVVCLRPLKAKKAAIEWAEQRALENDLGDGQHKMIRRWKQQYSAHEIKTTVRERRTRLSVSEHKRKETKSQVYKAKRQYFAEGQKLEESLLGRIEFTGGAETYGVELGTNDDDIPGDDDDDMYYPDDFELEEGEGRSLYD